MKRNDHFGFKATSKLLHPDAPTLEAVGVADYRVTPVLIEALEYAFPADFQASLIGSCDQMEANMTGQAVRIGQLQVINYLRSLIKDPTEQGDRT